MRKVSGQAIIMSIHKAGEAAVAAIVIYEWLGMIGRGFAVMSVIWCMRIRRGTGLSTDTWRKERIIIKTANLSPQEHPPMGGSCPPFVRTVPYCGVADLTNSPTLP